MNDKEKDRELQRAIEKIIHEEASELPHIQPLSNSVTENSLPPSGSPPDKAQDPSKISSWFITFMCMNTPLIGWAYLIYLAFNKKKTDRRNFARAYLFYKLLFLLISLIIFTILAIAALDLLDQLFTYMQML